MRAATLLFLCAALVGAQEPLDPFIAEGLRDPDPWTRDRSVRLLQELPWADARAPLLVALADSSFEVRRAAARVIGRLADGDGEPPAALLDVLAADPSAAVRGAACVALGEWSTPACAAAWEAAAGDPSAQVREAAFEALRDSPFRAVHGRVCLRLLDDPEPDLRVAAIEQSHRLPQPRAAIARLVGAQTDVDAEVREEARQRLLEEERAGMAVLRAALARFEDDPAFLHPGLDFLVEAASDRAIVLDLVLAELAAAEPDRRHAALGYLDSWFRIELPRVQAALFQAVHDSEPVVAAEAAALLYDDAFRYPAVAEHPDPWVRWLAVQQNWNEELPELEPALAALADPDPSIRQAALYQLEGASDLQPARQALLRCLADEDLGVREYALYLLDSYVGGVPDAVRTRCEARNARELVALAGADGDYDPENLLAVLRATHSANRISAATQLAQFPAHPGVGAALRRALGDPAVQVRAAAACSLGACALDDSVAVIALLDSLADPSQLVRDDALVALDSFHPQALAALLPRMPGLAANPSFHVRAAVAAWLGDVSSDGPVVVPALAGLAEDSSRAVRRAAFASFARRAGYGEEEALRWLAEHYAGFVAHSPDERRVEVIDDAFDSPAGTAFLRAACADPSRRVVDEARSRIARAGVATLGAGFLEQLRIEPDALRREELFDLARNSGAPLDGWLVDVLTDPDPGVRYRALVVFNTDDERLARRAAAAALRDPDASVRTLAETILAD